MPIPGGCQRGRNKVALSLLFFIRLSPADYTNVKRTPRAGSFLCLVVMWNIHRGGSVPRVCTERRNRPRGVALNLFIYYLGEWGLVSTEAAFVSGIGPARDARLPGI